jgi:RecJ-like exonuclease
MEESEFLTLAEAAQEAVYNSTSSLQRAHADQSGHAREIGLQRSVTSVISVTPRLKQGVWVTVQGA